MEVFSSHEEPIVMDEKKQESVVEKVSIQSDGFREKFEAKHRTQD